jgi:hypothetical protein
MARIKHYPENYTAADALLQGRNLGGRKIDNNTRLIRRAECIAIELHQTDVVQFFPNGSAVLNSGGWQTVTTKARINAAGFSISSERGVWLVYPFAGVPEKCDTCAGTGVRTFTPNPPAEPYKEECYNCGGTGTHTAHRDWSRPVAFRDGMRIFPSGRVTGAGPDPRETLKLRARVRRYAAAYVDALLKGNVGAPSGADCFFCGLSEEKTGKSLGEVTKDRDHVREHIRESYFVPSLVWRACDAFGGSKALRDWIGSLQTAAEPSFYRRDNAHVATQARRMIARWVFRSLGLAT